METLVDRWVVVKLTPKEGNTIYRVLASFYGGYLDGDSWKMNSGITEVTEDDKCYLFHGHSGSVYRCPKGEHMYGMGGLASGVLDNMTKGLKDNDMGTIELLPFDTDWLGVNY